ncbi:MAG: hypothetical protein AAFR64_11015 [Pseudomonadota bacterium]
MAKAVFDSSIHFLDKRGGGGLMFGQKQTNSKALAVEVDGLLRGSTVRLSRSEGSWSIQFGEQYLLSTHSWRLLGAKSIIVTSEDDGHQFGLLAPVDAELSANDALAGYHVTCFELDPRTGDAIVRIGGALALQIITWSMAYETWQLYKDGEFFAAVGNEGLR